MRLRLPGRGEDVRPSGNDVSAPGDGAASVADDAGAAVIDFVLMSVLLVFLLFAVLQIAVYFYARNIAAASAADAARYAAAEGIDPRAGATRAEQLLRQGLDDRDASAIRCTSTLGRDAPSGLATTTVHCTGRVRLFFTPLGLPLPVDVQSTVLREGVTP